jgi:uncharacterized protein (TIGR02996 family)
LDEEAGFLSAIHQTPAEETARLAYADWLDERGDPPHAAKAEFVRLELRLLHAPDEDPVHLDGPDHLRRVAAALAPDWLAVVSRPPLEGCRMRLVRPCPGRWDRLIPLGTPQLRFCDRCERTVHFCVTMSGARQYVVRGECVAVSPALERRPDDLGAPRPLSPSPLLFATPERHGLTEPPIPTVIDRPRLKRWMPSFDGRPFPPPLPDTGVGVRDLPPVPRRRRTGGRGRNRNIERQDWEDEE